MTLKSRLGPLPKTETRAPEPMVMEPEKAPNGPPVDYLRPRFLAIKSRVQEVLLTELDQLETLSRDELSGIVASVVDREKELSMSERDAVVRGLVDEITGYGPLQPLLDDPLVSEIMVNGPSRVYIERGGRLEATQVRFRDRAHLKATLEKMLAFTGRRVDDASPMVDARLPDGSRINAVIHPIAVSGDSLTIRKFSRDPLTIAQLVEAGTVTEALAEFLSAAVRGRLNIIVSGGTGSGKTTTLNALSAFIPSYDRIVTIEDAAELQLQQDHRVSLEARPANVEGRGEVPIRALVRNALRMRPDRIIVGEVRGGEALDMLQAMNTGHEGSLTTAHANTPRDCLSRLETMVLMAGADLPLAAIRQQVASALDLIVQQARLPDGTRRIVEVTEVVGMEQGTITTQDLFKFEQQGIGPDGIIKGQLVGSGLRPRCYEKLQRNGVEVSMRWFDG